MGEKEMNDSRRVLIRRCIQMALDALDKGEPTSEQLKAGVKRAIQMAEAIAPEEVTEGL